MVSLGWAEPPLFFLHAAVVSMAPATRRSGLTPSKGKDKEEKTTQLSRTLQLRLTYARLKVENGWASLSLDEVENLYFRSFAHQAQQRAEVAEATRLATRVARDEDGGDNEKEGMVLDEEDFLGDQYFDLDGGSSGGAGPSTVLGKRKAVDPAPYDDRPTSRPSHPHPTGSSPSSTFRSPPGLSTSFASTGGSSSSSAARTYPSPAQSHLSTTSRATSSSTSLGSNAGGGLASSYESFWSTLKTASPTAPSPHPPPVPSSSHLRSPSNPFLPHRPGTSTSPIARPRPAFQPTSFSALLRPPSSPGKSLEPTASTSTTSDRHTLSPSLLLPPPLPAPIPKRGSLGKPLKKQDTFTSLPPLPPLGLGDEHEHQRRASTGPEDDEGVGGLDGGMSTGGGLGYGVEEYLPLSQSQEHEQDDEITLDALDEAFRG